MTKLSKVQIAILRRMAEGEEIGWVDKGVRTRTLLGLRRRGLIEQIEPYWQGGRHRITPAGRAYLEGLE